MSEVRLENSFGVVDDFGMCKNEMELFIDETNLDYLMIEWIVYDPNYIEDSDYDEYLYVEHIGIWKKGNMVVDYDGVFQLPEQAIKMLQDHGLITKDVEVE